jgi:hypothetical protein
MDMKFLNHLSDNDLKQEHYTYLNKLKTTPDSIDYAWAKFHLKYQNDSLFLNTFKRGGSLFLMDSLAIEEASAYFLTKPKSLADKWFHDVLVDQSKAGRLAYLYYSAYFPQTIEIQDIPDHLQVDFFRLQKAHSKSPLLSASLSAIIPGAGKLYIGNKRSFAITLMSVSFMGLQTLESYTRLGVKHPLTILNAGFFTMFYVTNVLGSYRATRVKENEIRQYYLNRAASYTTFHTSK